MRVARCLLLGGWTSGWGPGWYRSPIVAAGSGGIGYRAAWIGYCAAGQANVLQTSCAFSGETVSTGSTSQSGGFT